MNLANPHDHECAPRPARNLAFRPVKECTFAKRKATTKWTKLAARTTQWHGFRRRRTGPVGRSTGPGRLLGPPRRAAANACRCRLCHLSPP